MVRDGSKYTVTIYSDANLSIELATGTGTVNTTAHLQYLKVMSGTASDTNAEIHGWIDDVNLWNGITSPNATARKFSFMDNTNTTEYSSETVSFDPINGDYLGNVRIPSLTTGTDFNINMYYDYRGTDYSPDPLTSFDIPTTVSDNFSIDNFTDSGTKCVVDTTNQELDWDFDRDGTHHATALDLGSALSDSAWVTRFEFKINPTTTDATNPHTGFIMLTDGDQSVNSSTPKDHLGIAIRLDTSGNRAIGIQDDNTVTTPDSVTPTDLTNNLFLVGQTVYFEFIRESTTSYRLNVYSDSKYTDLLETVSDTCDAGVIGLQYFKVMTSDNVANTGVFNGTIKNLQIWDGVAEAPTRESSVYDTNYKAVYHLQGNSVDSTIYGNDGTDTSVDWEQQNNDVGLLADGVNTKVDAGTDASTNDIWDGGGHARFRINPKSDGEGNEGRVLSKRVSIGWMTVCTAEVGSFLGLKFYINFSGTDGNWDLDEVIPLNEVTEVEILYNSDDVANTPTFIVNGIKYTVDNGGVSVVATPIGTRSSDSGSGFLIGNVSTNALTFDGFIDNVAISDKTRPSAQAIATYNAEKEGSDMLTVSATETQRYEKNQTGIKVKQRIDNKEFNLVNDEFVEVV